jgi:hypothetical protein
LLRFQSRAGARRIRHHPQVPFVQVCPVAHALPHEPQLPLEV